MYKLGGDETVRTLRLTIPTMHGPDVEALQRRLNQKGFACDVDGVYGGATANRVVEAKKRLHYPPARRKNFAGPLFRALLRTLPDAAQPAEIQLPYLFTPTHETAGLPHFPAIDIFADAGSTVGAPESGRVTFGHMIEWSLERRVGGWTCYYQGDSGDTYFLTHFGTLDRDGRYRAGEIIGTIGHVPNGWWQPHIHEGKHRGRFFPDL